MMSKCKKGYIYAGIALLIGCSVLLMLYNANTEEQWEYFLNSQKISEEIVSISLQKQLVTEVTFSDMDLIEKWKDYLKTLEIKKHHKKTNQDSNMNGGGKFCKIVTKSGEYLFSFKTPYGSDEIMLLMNDVFYEIKSDITNPFDDTYNLARERYGERDLFR